MNNYEKIFPTMKKVYYALAKMLASTISSKMFDTKIILSEKSLIIENFTDFLTGYQR